MRSKLIYSNYDKETGLSTVIIQNKYGVFSGSSFLQEEDKPYASSFAGCRYAEIKAEIKYMKERIKILQYQISALKDCYWKISQSKKFNSDSHEAKKFRYQIKHLEKQQKDWEEKIKISKKYILSASEDRVEKIKKMKHKDKNI